MMNKICILSAVNIRHMSLITLYTEKLRRDQISYDIIYMDKYGEYEQFDADNIFVFTNIINHDDNKIKKALQWFKFKKFAIPIIEKNEYDFIIVWNDLAIFMFANYLAKNWRGKYCLNIRDYCYEKNPYVYYRFKKVISESAFSTISSEGFLSFLPPYDYVHVHSLNLGVLSEMLPKKSFRTINEPIRITFVGSVRYFDLNKKLLDIFRNDNRFELHYYGTNAEKLEAYAFKNNITNASFNGTFPVNETAHYVGKADLINNLYGSGNNIVDYALSIKLYHGIYSRNPVLANKDTYSGEFVEKYGVGLAIDKLNEGLPDSIYKWYRNFDFNEFNDNCERLLAQIKEDNARFVQYYNHFVANTNEG